MSEIEKARERLYEKLYGDVTVPMSVVAAIEDLIDEKLIEHADRFRAIAREEIEAHEERLMHEAMHGEVTRGRECDETGALAEEASAAGDSIGGELSDMTALARRLAEVLKIAKGWSRVMINRSDRDEIDDALAEARKHKLIE